MRRLMTVLICALGLAASSSIAGAATWRFALEEIDGSIQDAYAEKFAELVAEKTDGEIEIEIFPYGALGTSAQLTELVRDGSIQFAFASPGHLGTVIPEVQVFNLHFLFSDDQRVNAMLLARNDAIYGDLAEAYDEKGLKLLAAIAEGWMVWTGDKPLTKPADFDGFKIRTMVSPLLLAAYEAYGANPTPMPYSEVYSGLQLNMIDGQVNPVFAIEEMSFYEQQSVMSFADHLPFVATVVANPSFFDGLPKAQQQAVMEAKHELDRYIHKHQMQVNQQRLQKIKDAGGTEMVYLDDSQREAFKKLAESTRQTYIDKAGERGQRILDKLKAGIKELEQRAGELSSN